MKIDPKIQFKSETGINATIRIESIYLEEDGGVDVIPNYAPGLYVDMLPYAFTKYGDGKDDIEIPSPEYVEWLESKIQ